MNHQAKKIQEFLKKYGIKSEVKELSETTKTAAEAAKALNCEIGQIAKSIVFKGKFSNQPILVIASGSNRIGEKTIATYLGEEIEKADADFVREKTGFAIGGVPPFGHREKIKTFIDEDLLRYRVIWAAAGTHNAVFPLSLEELVKATAGEVVKVI
jgi:prolyl-tRNA editing enzyme YbaK/EbsC (Cys-tRNA(Pro) deacylase)